MAAGKGDSKGRRRTVWLVAGMALILVVGWIAWVGSQVLPDIAAGDAPGDWSMIIYPSRADHTDFLVTPRFRTARYCVASARDRLKELHLEATGDYECGFRCGRDGDPHKGNVCDRTVK